jgi:hypothetical protein
MKLVYPALGRLEVHDPVNVALFLSMVTALLFTAVASVASVSAAVRRSEVRELLFQSALGPAVLAAVAMVVVLVGLSSGAWRSQRKRPRCSRGTTESWQPAPLPRGWQSLP